MTNMITITYVGIDGELHKKRYYIDAIVELKLEYVDENIDSLLEDLNAQKALIEEEKIRTARARANRKKG